MGKNAPMKLSIITINLNDKEGLAKTVESVCAQSYKDFEFIIVDGGSQDGSIAIIKNAGHQIPSLVWVSEPDTGVFNAMNKGINLAKGDYLLFLNSGDYLVEDTVIDQVFSRENSADILLGIARVSQDGETIWNAYPRESYSLNDFYHGSLAHQAAFIKKELFTRLGNYREDLRFMSDWEFFLRSLILNRCTLAPLDITICDYNLDGISSDKRNDKAMNLEKKIVYHDLGLDRIVVDYNQRDQWMNNHKPLLWAWNKPLLRTFIKMLYSLAQKVLKA